MPRPTASTLQRLTDRISIPGWVDDKSRDTQPVLESFTQEPLVDVPLGRATDVSRAFLQARQAQTEWAATDLAERAEILRRFADLVYRNRHQLLDVIQAETGKNRSSALDEVLDVILTARFYATKGPHWLRTRPIAGAIPGLTKAVVQHVPLGVVGVICPWNYPLTLSIGDGLAAVMAGNGVVLKPDSQTPLSALAAVSLLDQAGLPPQLWQVIPGSGKEVGSAIVEQADYLMFTGSSVTGAQVAQAASARLIPFSAELGGKNPMIVGHGADLHRVAEIATRACFASTGQLCLSIERIYVEEASYEQFCRVLTRRTSAMALSADYDFGPEMGCLVSVEHLDKVRQHVDDALSKGARVLTGGKLRTDLGPTFFEPTILVDVPVEATCYATETFGPVVSIYPVTSLDEAVDRANDSPYGLNSAVFCADDATAQQIAQRLRTGLCNINEGYAAAWTSLEGPMGGMGRSGVGYRHGETGLTRFTHARTIATQSKLLHFGGPGFISRKLWPKLLSRATNALRHWPGR